MPLMTVVQQPQRAPELKQGALMIHKAEPPMVVIVDEVLADEQSFFGTDLECGVRIEYDADQFVPFIGKLTLEQ